MRQSLHTSTQAVQRLCSSSSCIVKPMPLLLAELQPEKAIMVGDRIGDIRAGKDNGLPTIAAAFGYGNDSEFAEATQRADTMEELQALLLRFAKE